jgi:iron-sulfur cluster repair protein YtfE (RIC family)
MSETVNQENATVETEAPAEERRFTQAELDKVVADRLARERQKYEGFAELKEKAAKFDEMEAASKTELQKATEKAEKLEKELNSLKKAEEVRVIREKVAKEEGIPVNLLTGETEEDCVAQAKAINAFANPDTYPALRDGGEVQNTIKGSTKQQFADWANKAFR